MNGFDISSLPVVIVVVIALLVVAGKVAGDFYKTTKSTPVAISANMAGAQTTEFWDRKIGEKVAEGISKEISPVLQNQTMILKQIAATQERMAEEVAQMSIQFAVSMALQAADRDRANKEKT